MKDMTREQNDTFKGPHVISRGSAKPEIDRLRALLARALPLLESVGYTAQVDFYQHEIDDYVCDNCGQGGLALAISEEQGMHYRSKDHKPDCPVARIVAEIRALGIEEE